VSEKKKTGLGTGVFFQKDQPVDIDAKGPVRLVVPPKPPKPEKVRTTVLLQKKTLIAMEMLKVEARKQGLKATLGDVLEEAVQSLMEKKKLEVQGLDKQ